MMTKTFGGQLRRRDFLRGLILTAILLITTLPALGQLERFTCENITNRTAFIPHLVAGGNEEITYTTTVTLSNPRPNKRSIEVTVYWDDFRSESEVLELGPGETRVIPYLREDSSSLVGGWLRVDSKVAITTLAHILGRDNDGEVIAEVTVPTVEPRSRFALPVLRNDLLADNTGIAIVSPLGGLITAELTDPKGQLVARRDLVAASFQCCPNCELYPPICAETPDFRHRQALLLQELLTDLPEDFQQGLLSLEHTSYLGSDELRQGPQYPFGMAVIGLYTSGFDLRSAPGQVIDIPVRFEISIDGDLDPGEFADDFGLSIVRTESKAAVQILFADGTVDAARVLAGSPKVNYVCYRPGEWDDVAP